MRYDPDRHHRRSMRLKGYDYTQEGAYVVTVCTFQRECTLGEIDADGVMHLSSLGQVVMTCWNTIPTHFPHVDLDAFVVMPNHIHGIVVIVEQPKIMQRGQPVGAQYIAPLRPDNRESQPPSNAFAYVARGSLGSIVRTFKAAVTRQINRSNDTPQAPFWQRNFYDNIIKDERMLNQFRFYIENNPAQWATDRHRPPDER